MVDGCNWNWWDVVTKDGRWLQPKILGGCILRRWGEVSKDTGRPYPKILGGGTQNEAGMWYQKDAAKIERCRKIVGGVIQRCCEAIFKDATWLQSKIVGDCIQSWLRLYWKLLPEWFQRWWALHPQRCWQAAWLLSASPSSRASLLRLRKLIRHPSSPRHAT